MNNKLDKKQVEQIARLCALTLTDDEVVKFEGMLQQTIDYIQILSELDTEEIDETFQVTGLTNIYRNDDGKAQTLSVEDALENAPKKKDNLFCTEAVFDR